MYVEQEATLHMAGTTQHGGDTKGTTGQRGVLYLFKRMGARGGCCSAGMET